MITGCKWLDSCTTQRTDLVQTVRETSIDPGTAKGKLGHSLACSLGSKLCDQIHVRLLVVNHIKTFEII